MTKIHSFGLLEPDRGYAEVSQQMWRAHRYRNDLVRLELDRRDQVHILIRQYFPRLLELDALIEQAEAQVVEWATEIKQGKSEERRRRVPPEQAQEMARRRQVLADLRAEHKRIRLNAYGPEEVSNLRRQLRQATDRENPQEVTRLDRELARAVEDWYGQVPQAGAFQEGLRQQSGAHYERQKQLRAQCGLFWGTYLVVEDAARSFGQGSPPKFHRWTGEGRIAVQLQGGLTIPELLACEDSRLRLEILPAGTRTRTPRREVDHGTPASPREGGRSSRAYLWVRVGSTRREVLIEGQWRPVERGRILKRRTGQHLAATLADGTEVTVGPGAWRGEAEAPVWARFPIDYHRDLPAEGAIKWVYVHRHKTPHGHRWKASIVVQGGEGERLSGAGTVAINLGWRVLPDGSLRVATWVGEDGHQGHVTIPADRIRQGERAGEIQSIRDNLRNEAITRLLAFGREVGRENLPGWLTEALSTLAQWRSSDRLAGLVWRWRFARFTGDEAIFHWLEGWRFNTQGKPRLGGFRRQDRHLAQYQAGLRDGYANWRKQFFWEVANTLSARYGRLLVAKVNLRELTSRPEVEEEDTSSTSTRRNSRLGSPGILLGCLRERFAEVVGADPSNLTQTCSICGRLDAFDARTELVRQCRHCDHVEDQDLRHCRNLLRLDRGEPASTEVAN